MQETLPLLVLHCINTIIYTNIYYTGLSLLTLTIPLPSPYPSYSPHPSPFPLTPPPPPPHPTPLTHIFDQLYQDAEFIKKIHSHYKFICNMVLICTYIQDVILFRKYFDSVVSKLIIINILTPFRWLYALNRSFCFNNCLRTYICTVT